MIQVQGSYRESLRMVRLKGRHIYTFNRYWSVAIQKGCTSFPRQNSQPFLVFSLSLEMCYASLTAEYRGVEVIRVKCSCLVQVSER